MPLRTKIRRVSSRRLTVAARPKAKLRSIPRPGHAKISRNGKSTSKSRAKQNGKAHSNGVSAYTKAIRFLNTLTDHERLRIVRYNSSNFDLNRMRNLLRKLGNPQEDYKTVHVAGTKGKGSTCTMTASMLQACGHRVGLYTSPHLCDIRERICINGDMISHADFARLIRMVAPHVNRMNPSPSFFDGITAIAFKYFAEQDVEIAVVETGLGGRLDSTNVIKPEVTAITSISKDHMQQLGYTLAKIAEEKGGIFKHGIPALTVIQDPEVETVLKRIAEKVGAPFDVTGKSIEFSYRFESSRMLGPHNRICLTTPNSKFEHLAVPLIGEHVPYDSMVVIFGCCGDKDIPGMLERITSGADKVIFTKVDSVRTADPEELAARYIELYGKMAQVAATLEEALEIANRAVTKEDLICITGSFYLVGEAKKVFAKLAKQEAAEAAAATGA